MGNKYVIIAILLAILIGGGVVYQNFLRPESATPITTGKEQHITVYAHKDSWSFDPEIIEAEQGDRIFLTIINEDAYDHGFAIDAFGISRRLPALSTTKLDFVVTQPGEFPYYCSVACGEGEVDGAPRGHVDQVGRLKVYGVIKDSER